MFKYASSIIVNPHIGYTDVIWNFDYTNLDNVISLEDHSCEFSYFTCARHFEPTSIQLFSTVHPVQLGSVLLTNAISFLLTTQITYVTASSCKLKATRKHDMFILFSVLMFGTPKILQFLFSHLSILFCLAQIILSSIGTR